MEINEKREDNTKINHKRATNINEFYLTHQDIKLLGNIFITMNKQTNEVIFLVLKMSVYEVINHFQVLS